MTDHVAALDALGSGGGPPPPQLTPTARVGGGFQPSGQFDDPNGRVKEICTGQPYQSFCNVLPNDDFCRQLALTPNEATSPLKAAVRALSSSGASSAVRDGLISFLLTNVNFDAQTSSGAIAKAAEILSTERGMTNEGCKALLRMFGIMTANGGDAARIVRSGAAAAAAKAMSFPALNPGTRTELADFIGKGVKFVDVGSFEVFGGLVTLMELHAPFRFKKESQEAVKALRWDAGRAPLLKGQHFVACILSGLFPRVTLKLCSSPACTG